MKFRWENPILVLREVIHEQRWYFFFFSFTLLFLILYSYTQVDLSLTLSRSSIFQTVEKGFQYIGYFNRPLSTLLFIFLITFLTIIYISMVKKTRGRKISHKTLWSFIFFLSIAGIVSYTTFSYDLFNYIFDAKILTFYHQNPYFHKALDYPTDPMLSFMHWTHRMYPYGPVWLGLTIIPSILGLHYFAPTFFLFKILAALGYVGSVFMIGRIMKQVMPGKQLLAMALFAFNPLVIIEVLMSGHNDIWMMFLALWSLFYFVNKKYLLAFILLILSIGVKYATALLLPIYIIVFILESRKVKISFGALTRSLLIAMIAAVGLAAFRTTLQPWYFLFILPFAALLGGSYYNYLPSLIISLALVFNYIPFLYTGNWDSPIPEILVTVNTAAVILSILLICILFILKRRFTISV